MPCFIIGVGGTGAKVVEAAIHLAAAGLLPDEELFVQFVDPDGSNGSLNRAISTARAYANVQTNLDLQAHGDHLHAFRTKIELGQPEVWSPLADRTRRTLGDMMSYDQLVHDNAPAARLFDVLYSQPERMLELNVGFKGHPSIGAAVLADTLTFKEGEWLDFSNRARQCLSNGREVTIVIVGSIFGGTGASGLPTIGRLIKDEVFQGLHGGRLAAVLALPYFSFRFSDTNTEIRADAGSFIPNTKAALKYYHQKGYLNIFDSLYAFGERYMEDEPEVSVGGETQKNTPHPAELYGALAAIDFFRNNRHGLQLSGRREAETIGAIDLPWVDPRKDPDRLHRLTCMAFAYLGVYFPVLEKNPAADKYKYPWLVDYFHRQEPGPDWKKRASDLATYSKLYLHWLAALHGVEKPKLDLTSWTIFASKNGNRTRILDPLNLRDSDNLLTTRDQNGSGLDRIWNAMSSSKKYRNVEGFDAFLLSLSAACASLGS